MRTGLMNAGFSFWGWFYLCRWLALVKYSTVTTVTPSCISCTLFFKYLIVWNDYEFVVGLPRAREWAWELEGTEWGASWNNPSTQQWDRDGQETEQSR